MGTSSMSTAKHQVCVWVMLPNDHGRRGVLIHPVGGNIHPFLLGFTKHGRGSIPLCKFGCTHPQFVFTDVIFSPLAQMLVVQQYTGQIISNLIGKILTVMTPGQPGTIGSRDSILKTAKLSCRLFLHFLFWQLTLLINHVLYMGIHQLQSV